MYTIFYGDMDKATLDKNPVLSEAYRNFANALAKIEKDRSELGFISPEDYQKFEAALKSLQSQFAKTEMTEEGYQEFIKRTTDEHPDRLALIYAYEGDKADLISIKLPLDPNLRVLPRTTEILEPLKTLYSLALVDILSLRMRDKREEGVRESTQLTTHNLLAGCDRAIAEFSYLQRTERSLEEEGAYQKEVLPFMDKIIALKHRLEKLERYPTYLAIPEINTLHRELTRTIQDYIFGEGSADRRETPFAKLLMKNLGSYKDETDTLKSVKDLGIKPGKLFSNIREISVPIPTLSLKNRIDACEKTLATFSLEGAQKRMAISPAQLLPISKITQLQRTLEKIKEQYQGLETQHKELTQIAKGKATPEYNLEETTVKTIQDKLQKLTKELDGCIQEFFTERGSVKFSQALAKELNATARTPEHPEALGPSSAAASYRR